MWSNLALYYFISFIVFNVQISLQFYFGNFSNVNINCFYLKKNIFIYFNGLNGKFYMELSRDLFGVRWSFNDACDCILIIQSSYIVGHILNVCQKFVPRIKVSFSSGAPNNVIIFVLSKNVIGKVICP